MSDQTSPERIWLYGKNQDPAYTTYLASRLNEFPNGVEYVLASRNEELVRRIRGFLKRHEGMPIYRCPTDSLLRDLLAYLDTEEPE